CARGIAARATARPAARDRERPLHEHARIRTRALHAVLPRLQGRALPLVWTRVVGDQPCAPSRAARARARAARDGFRDAPDPRGDARAVRAGLRRVRARARSRQRPRHRPLRAAERADPRHDGRRAAPDGPAHGIGARRDGVLAARPRDAARQLGDQRRLPDDPGPAALHRRVDHPDQHRRRRHLRVHRPARRLREGDALMAATATAVPRRSIFRHSGVRHMPALFTAVSCAIVAVIVFLALFGWLVEPHDPAAQDLFHTSAGPSSQHLLGTDGLGRDIFSRMIAGAGAAITGPFVVAFTGLLAASALGILSGYMGGAIDMVIQRFVDFMFALPGLLIAIVIVGVVGGGYWLAVMVLSLLNFAGGVRILRGAALEQRALPYVEAARTLGVPRRRIMYRHIWRNISPI